LLDDIAGLGIAWVSVMIGAWATGQGAPPTELLAAEEELVALPVQAETVPTVQPEPVSTNQVGSRIDGDTTGALAGGEGPTARPLY